ncbi:MAG: TIGR03086 family metal-binding protein [Acidimicrobiales bacterium]
MDLTAALAQTFDHTHVVIAGVKPDQLGNPTPCSEWDVRGLLSHTLGVVAGIGAAVGGDAQSSPDSFVLADDVAAQFRALADRTLAAWRAVGLDGETNIGAGPMPRQAAISINLLDTATHSWDIARATGQPEALPTELADMILGVSQQVVSDDVRRVAGFAPAIGAADDADPTTKLVAFLGRQP